MWVQIDPERLYRNKILARKKNPVTIKSVFSYCYVQFWNAVFFCIAAAVAVVIVGLDKLRKFTNGNSGTRRTNPKGRVF